MSEKISKLIDTWPGSYQELCMVYEGEKDVLFDGLYWHHDRNLIEKTLNNFGLEVEMWSSDEDPADISIAIGKKKEICKEVKKIRKKGDFYKLGLMLGYPKCCVKHHLGKRGNKSFSREESTIFNEGDNMELDYRINTLLNIQSIGTEGLEKIGSRIKEYFGNEYYYLSHIPCSVGCGESFEMAKKTQNVIKKYLPEENKKTERALRRGFIIFDFLDYIIFDYEKRKKRIKISNVVKTPIADEEKLRKVKNADWIKLEKQSVLTDKSKRLSCCRTIIFY